MAEELTGQLLNRYELRKRLGRGGMGDVYQAVDTTLDRVVAVKILHGHLAEEANFRERFEREAKLMATLNHPNIVQVYDFGYDDEQGVYCLVMGFLPSKTLEDHIAALRESPVADRLEAVRAVFQPLISAVDYAHSRGMVHRDIKPSNILINEDGDPVLADFGLARMIATERLTLSGMTTGTPAYMSPEQGMGETGDARSDIYALGIILFEMLTGKPPFHADTPFGVIMKHVNDPVPELALLAPGIAPDVDTVLLCALAKNPDERYQSVTDFLGDLTASLEGKPISEYKPAARTTIKLPAVSVKEQPVILWVALGALAVVVLAAVIFGQPFDFGGGEPAVTESVDATPTGEQATIPSMTGPADIFDDFSDPSSGWPVQSDGPVTFGYEDGAYRFTNSIGGRARPVTLDYVYTSTFLEVEATLLDGQPESGYGLVFRWVDEGNFYVFTINGRGQVSMWAFENGATWRELRGLADTWTDSGAVLTGGQPNTLTVFAEGSHLVGMVNHEVVIDLDDDTYERGAVGFYVATTQSPTDSPLADVLFDNFVVQPSIPAMTP